MMGSICKKKILTMIMILVIAAQMLSGCQFVSQVPVFTKITENTNKTDTGTPSNPINHTPKERQTVAYFSTVTSLLLYDDYSVAANVLRFEETWGEMERILKDIENSVSVSVSTSDIARFNSLAYGESIRISKTTADLYQVAKAAYQDTDGLFDPTVYPLVDLWGFTPRFNQSLYTPTFPFDRPRHEAGFALPDEKYITAFMNLVDLSKVVLSGDEKSGFFLTKWIPPVIVNGISYQAQLDFGGIAKGFAVDAVSELLADRGYAYGSFSCGGSSIALMKNASKRSLENKTFRFNLGLRKPRDSASSDDIYLSVATRDVRLSSSGDYDHSYEQEGIVYSHIINPKTGYPMNTPAHSSQKGIAVLTILNRSAGYSDAITTALCVMGFEKALQYVNEHVEDDQVVMVLYNSEHPFYEVVTNIPADEFMIQDSAYVMASRLDDDGKMIYEGTLIR